MSKYLDIFELSEYLRMSPGSIRNLVLRRKIPFRKPAGRLLFDQEEIDSWIKGADGISLEEIQNRI